MTTKEFLAIGKLLLPDLPGFVMNRRLMLMTPVGQILRGVSFEPSGFGKKPFYVSVFVMPLCVPAEYLHLTVGKRVRHQNGVDGWNADEPNLLAELSASLKFQAIPFLSRAESLLDFVELARSLPPGNQNVSKAIAYVLARAGRISEAIEALHQLPDQLNLNVGWQRDIADQAAFLRAKLSEDPADAQKQLDAWEAETIHNLGLESFR
jgi:hypothetical protein